MRINKFIYIYTNFFGYEEHGCLCLELSIYFNFLVYLGYIIKNKKYYYYQFYIFFKNYNNFFL